MEDAQPANAESVPMRHFGECAPLAPESDPLRTSHGCICTTSVLRSACSRNGIAAARWHDAQAMSFAVVHSRALDALQAQPVTVEVHLANGLPSFTLVGLADTEVKESRERVRAALGAAGGVFGASMQVSLIGHGPVTLLLEA